MSIKAILYSVLFLCLTAFSTQGQDVQKPQKALKTSLTSPLSPLPFGYLGLEIPIDNSWSLEGQVGMTFGAYGEGDPNMAPLGSFIIYKKLPLEAGAKNPTRLGFQITYKRVSFNETHSPCIEYTNTGSSGWFDFPHECTDRISDVYEHKQDHHKYFLVVGKRFSDKKFVWELDLALGLENVTTTEVGKVESLPHPDYDDSDNPFDINLNPWSREAGTEWLPTIKIDMKFGAKLNR
jgi:hypothetical protein